MRARVRRGLFPRAIWRSTATPRGGTIGWREAWKESVNCRNMTPRLLHESLLAFGLVVACGGSAFPGAHDAHPPSHTGGAADDGSGAAGANAVAGSAVGPASGGTATSIGGAPGGGE